MKKIFLGLFLLVSTSLFSQQTDSAIVKKFVTDFAAKEFVIAPSLKTDSESKVTTLSFLDGSETFTDSDFYSRLLAVMNGTKTLKSGEVDVIEYLAPSVNLKILIDQKAVEDFKDLVTINSKSAFLRNLLDSAKKIDETKK